MKLKKVMAGLLTLAMVLTAIPTEFMSYAENGDVSKTGTIKANESDYILVHEMGRAVSAITDEGYSGQISDAFAKEVKGSLEENNPYYLDNYPEIFKKDLLPYVAMKVDAAQAGEYTMQVSMNVRSTALIDTFAVIVDGQKTVYNFGKTKGDTAQIVDIPLTLSQGEHTVVFTSIMPKTKEVASSVTSTNWYNYYATNSGYYGFVLPEGVTALGAPSESDVLHSLGIVNVFNSAYIYRNHFEKGDDTNNATYELCGNGESSDIGKVRCSSCAQANINKKLTYQDNYKNTNYSKIYNLSMSPIVFAKEDLAYVAMKVNADVAGTYKFVLNMAGRGDLYTTTIGAIVNGQTQVIDLDGINGNFADFEVSVPLEQGENIVVFTTLLPSDVEAVSAAKGEGKEWYKVLVVRTQFRTFTVPSGIDVLSAPTKEEVVASFGTRIEAEDADYTIANIKYAHNNLDTGKNGSGTGLVKGAFSEVKQTVAELERFLDKQGTPYIQYVVQAPKDGTYNIRVGCYPGYWGEGLTYNDKPYITVWVNGNVYQNKTDATWNQLNSINFSVELKEGINIIRCTELTMDQATYESTSKGGIYTHYDYLDIATKLTPVSVSDLTSTNVEAADKEHVLQRNYEYLTEDGVDYLGGYNTNNMKNDRVSVETLKDTMVSRLTYTALKVTAENDGYYDISANVKARDWISEASRQCAMIVDANEVYALSLKNAREEGEDEDGNVKYTYLQQEVGASVYLTEGTHTIIITSPMPLTKIQADSVTPGEEDNYKAMNWAYQGLSFYSYTLGDGLNLEATPVEEDLYTTIYQLGDVNTDGAIDKLDTSNLRQYLVNCETEINLNLANIHLDEKIDVRDLVALLIRIKEVSVQPTAYLTNEYEAFAIQNENYVSVSRLTDGESVNNEDCVVIQIDSNEEGQEIQGFGAAMTDTSAYVLNQIGESNPTELDMAMTKLFDKEYGIGLNMLRNTIGASDFTPDVEPYGAYYTYDDMGLLKSDTDLSEFDFSKAEPVVALTKRVQELVGKDNFKLFLAPWSAPLWMKQNQLVWTGGTSEDPNGLKEEYYDEYANYLVKTIEAYHKENVSVYSISPQNEPMTDATSKGYPGMMWTKEQLVSFSADLRSALNNANLKDIKILNLDYNFTKWEDAKYITDETNKNGKVTDGIAFHWYDGSPEVMKNFSEGDAYKDIPLYVTEASSGSNNLDSFLNITEMITRSLRSGASGFMTWNLALSSEGGPTINDINEHCTSVVTCDAETNKITYTREFYALAHFSKFIDSGAVRVESTETALDENYDLVNVVAKNLDGTMVAVIVNSSGNDSKVCKLVCDRKVIEIKVAPRSTVTLTWDPASI